MNLFFSSFMAHSMKLRFDSSKGVTGQLEIQGKDLRTSITYEVDEVAYSKKNKRATIYLIGSPVALCRFNDEAARNLGYKNSFEAAMDLAYLASENNNEVITCFVEGGEQYRKKPQGEVAYKLTIE